MGYDMGGYVQVDSDDDDDDDDEMEECLTTALWGGVSHTQILLR